MKLFYLTRYDRSGASSRIRSFQYFRFLKERGFSVDFSALFSDSYLSALYSGGWLAKEAVGGYARRLHALLRVRQFELLVIEKELFPFLPAWFERLLSRWGVPYVVDYDDALFHRYDLHRLAVVRGLLGHKIDSVMGNAELVVAGNEYLAQRARAAGARRVEIIPTVIDSKRYFPNYKNAVGPLVVGWVGTPKTSRYLRPLLPIFESLQCEMDVRFVAVGGRSSDFAGTPVEVWPWSEETEVAAIQEFDIGIMPLADSPWERGKCGYKLIQYMACGLPVIASPVGVNTVLVEEGKSGHLANALEDWERCLKEMLLMDPRDRKTMG